MYCYRSSVPARTQQRAPAPQPQQPTQVAAPAQPQQPGLFAQMAATAGGVAVGSAIVCIHLPIDLLIKYYIYMPNQYCF